MKANVRARYNAYTLALAHLKEHEALTSDVPAVAAAYEAAKKLHDEISETQNRRSQRQESATLSKTNLHEALAAEAFSIASLITSYAGSMKDPLLAEDVNFSRTSLEHALAIDLEARASIILAKANEYADALKPFGLSAERLAAYTALLNDFHTGKLAPRRYIAERRDATMYVEDLVRQLAAIFDEQLDGLLLQFSKSQPEFYNQYLIKRTVVLTGSRKTQVVGTLTEKGSGSPVAGANISIKGSAFSTTSEADGSYTLYSSPFSGITILYEKQGYRTVEIAAAIPRGKAVRQSVEMEKI